MLLSLGLAFIAVNRVSIDSALLRIESNLDATARVFLRVLDNRNQNLLSRARFLSSDHAYRQVYGFGGREDLELATENHRRRADADMMMLVSLEGEVLADTLHPGGESVPEGIQRLLDTAYDSANGEVRAMQLVDNVAYQLVVVPLFAPDPVAMVVLGFRIGEQLAESLKSDTKNTDISLLFKDDDKGVITAACTLGAERCGSQMKLYEQQAYVEGGNQTVQIAGEPWVTRVLKLPGEGQENLAILQRSLNSELASYFRLRDALLLVFGGALLMSVFGASLLAGSVTRPVALLARGAKRIADGQYESRVDITQKDELGRLANSFNDMASGLQERDKVRNLLGKVVSPQIADELLRKDIELGGEEVEASILFSDIRGFTSISEQLSPQQVIEMLNLYLTEMNDIIESCNGVVDKYIGDAVMALFGTPLPHEESACNAVDSALTMQRAMAKVNQRFADWNIPTLEIGVGINTGRVVAGNMGSMSRLNYTVLGDAVNLASRLEGLCKTYGVPVIISETTLAACPGLPARELDRVRVKGKKTAATIYQPLEEAQIDAAELAMYEEALVAYRAQDWSKSGSLFEELQERSPQSLYQLYLQRIERFAASPPPTDWDGVNDMRSK